MKSSRNIIDALPNKKILHNKALNQLLGQKLHDRWWRLNHLYTVRNPYGSDVVMELNKAQQMLYENMTSRNVILKARQQGMTTFLTSGLALDLCLMNTNISCGIIAHTQQAAQDILDKKIKMAYENLHPFIKNLVTVTKSNATTIHFSSGSSITVGLSHRSGTHQFLHISELGHISANSPRKAEEVMTGSLATVHAVTDEVSEAIDAALSEKVAGQQIFIESTAYGSFGKFFDVCNTAIKMQRSGEPISDMDYTFHFFPWYYDDKYRLPKTISQRTVVPSDMEVYFDGLETTLTLEQKTWYIKKQNEMGHLMKREYPSTPEEAFEESLDSQIYKYEMAAIKKNGHIRNIPHDPRWPVYTFWDLGYGGNKMAIWFMQYIDGEYRFIEYHESTGNGWSFYVKELNSKPYTYGMHYWPHDGANNRMYLELMPGMEFASNLGINPITIVPKVASEKTAIMSKCKPILLLCHFDHSKCTAGIKALESACWSFDRTNGGHKDTPRKDEFIDGIDSFRTFACGFKGTSSQTNGYVADISKRMPLRAKTDYDIFGSH